MTVPAEDSDPAPQGGRPVLTVALPSVAQNWRTLRDAAPHAEVAAVVKADGYGLGAVPVAAKLKAIGCETFFVATLDEGRGLRPVVGAAARIFVLNGLPPGGTGSFAAHALTPVLNSLDEVRDWADAGRRPAAIQLDTGMSRAGLSPAELDVLVADSALLARLDLVLVMSHLACGDESDHPSNRAQLSRFKTSLARLPAAPASLAASGGIFLGPEFHFDLVRPGIALYGGNPLAAGPNPMQPVAMLTADVLGVRTIARGETAGYAGTYAAVRDTRLAVCNIGYADGILRSLSNRGVAYIGDIPCPYAGRVSMDLLTIDVTAVPPHEVVRGTQVEILGPHMSVEDMAARAGTANYEILTGLGNRFTRVALDSHWTRIV